MSIQASMHRPYESPKGMTEARSMQSSLQQTPSSVCGVNGSAVQAEQKTVASAKKHSRFMQIPPISSAAIVWTRVSASDAFCFLLIIPREWQMQYPACLLPRLTCPAPRRMLPPTYHKKDAGEEGANVWATPLGIYFALRPGANRTVVQWVWWSMAVRHGSPSLRQIFRLNWTAGDLVRVALPRNVRKKMSVIFCQGCLKGRP